MPRVDLDVSFEEKDQVKALGARWDATARCWYVPDGVNPEPFSPWRQERPAVEANVRAKRFAVVLSETLCWKCQSPMPVACLAVGPFHQEREDDADGEEGWETVDYASVLSTITYIAPAALQLVLTVAPWMRMATSSSAGSRYLANVCPNCEALQGDFFLHSEPGSAFFPMDEQAKSRIHVHWFQAPVYVRAGDIGMDCDWL